MKTHVRRFARRCESGVDVSFTAMWYIWLMFMLLALVFEFGRFAYISSVSYNAARAAVQEAAKNVNPKASAASQEIVFNPNTLAVANNMYADLTDGVIPPPVVPPVIDIHDLHTGQQMVRIEVHTEVKLTALDFLGTFGAPAISIPPVMLSIEAYAEPAYGINKETQ